MKNNPITYSDDFHCIASKLKTVGKSFKTIYSVDVKYHCLDAMKPTYKTFTSNYGSYMLAKTRFDVDSSCRQCPSRMEISKITLRSTSYLGGKKVGSDVLRRVSFDSFNLFDDTMKERLFKENVCEMEM